MSTPAAALAEIEQQADAAYEQHPGQPLSAAQVEAVRRILPAPQAERQAA